MFIAALFRQVSYGVKLATPNRAMDKSSLSTKKIEGVSFAGKQMQMTIIILQIMSVSEREISPFLSCLGSIFYINTYITYVCMA